MIETLVDVFMLGAITLTVVLSAMSIFFILYVISESIYDLYCSDKTLYETWHSSRWARIRHNCYTAIAVHLILFGITFVIGIVVHITMEMVA